MPEAVKKSENVPQKLLQSLDTIKDELSQGEVELLEKLFQSDLFYGILKIGKCLDNARIFPEKPYTKKALETHGEILSFLRASAKNDEQPRELMRILDSTQLQALLLCHDIIAAEEFLPLRMLPPKLRARMQKVVMEKDISEPLGITIRKHIYTGGIVVGRILFESPAEKEGSLTIGDEIVSINGTETEGLSLDNVVHLMSLKCKRVNLDVIKHTDLPRRSNTADSKLFLRALFDYEPMNDAHLSCKQAGCAFQKGDILQVLDRSDDRWWQARRVKGKGAKVGLIPSRTFQEKRLAEVRGKRTSLLLKDGEEKGKSHLEMSLLSNSSASSEDLLNSSLLSTSWLSNGSGKEERKRKKSRSKKIKFEMAKTEDYKLDDIAVYQEVRELTPDSQKPRPILLLGAPGMCCEKIARKMVESDPDNFSLPVMNTSRARMAHEKKRQDLNFLSNSEFEKERKRCLMVNVKQCPGYMTGVPVHSIVELQQAGKTCVTDVQPRDMRNGTLAELLPLVVFVKAPPREQLQTASSKNVSRQEDGWGDDEPLADKDLSALMEQSSRIEVCCARFIDLTFVNEDIETTFNQIYHHVTRLRSEPQWIRTWTTSF